MFNFSLLGIAFFDNIVKLTYIGGSMSWSKKVSVTFHRIQAAEDTYFGDFHNNMQTMISTGNMSGSFESGELQYHWELLEMIDTDKTPMYMFSVVKERSSWPVLIKEDLRQELFFADAILGDISYGLICPAYKFLICFAAGSGGCLTQFKKLLGQFSVEGIVKLEPVFEEKIDEKVLLWDSYKKVSISMNMPSGDDVVNFAATKIGEYVKLLGYLGGLKLDITVSAGSGKEMLSSMMVKDIIPELLSNDLCTSLTVRGSDFENTTPEQFDLKNAQIKYSETVEIEGNYITDTDAKQILMRALNERSLLLFSDVYYGDISSQDE